MIRYNIEDLELLENWLSEKSGDKVKVKVVVTSEGEAKNALAGKEVLANTENLAVDVSGKGTIKIEVYIDDNYMVQQVNLNEANTITFN